MLKYLYPEWKIAGAILQAFIYTESKQAVVYAACIKKWKWLGITQVTESKTLAIFFPFFFEMAALAYFDRQSHFILNKIIIQPKQ